MRRLLWGFALCLLAAGNASAAPLEGITNGGFENTFLGITPAVPALPGAVPGWSAPSINTVVASGIGNPGNAAVLAPFSVGSASISQTFATQGQPDVQFSFQYDIHSLDLGRRTNNGPDILTVTANGHTIGTFSLDDRPGGGSSDSNWVSFTSPVLSVASLGGGPITLNFSLADTSSELTSVRIDNVSAQLTPEPATLAALGLMGLAGAGYVRRRQKAAV